MQPIGAYSPARNAGNIIFISGQIPLDPETMILCSPDIEKQVEQVFKNLEFVCKQQQLTLQNIVKLNVYLVNLEDVKYINHQIKMLWQDSAFPARAVIGISALPKDSLVEVEAILYNDHDQER